MRLLLAVLMFLAFFIVAMSGAMLGEEYGAPVVHEVLYGN